MTSGSVVGVARVEAEAALDAALVAALDEGERVVIESGVAGTEVSCPVLGDAHRDRRALEVIEIVPRAAFFDYEAKYTEGVTDEVCPARVPDEVAARLKDAAVRLHDVFGCLDLSRSDFIVRADGSIVFLELNTLPGMTPMSLFPKAAAVAGMSYEDFVEALVEGAVRRARGGSPTR